ncbi:hypothetical protein E4U21_004297 [Claviceps maximensis]|nr:hypothetical protein E4U21_004297 [Claviceps maximensis]
MKFTTLLGSVALSTLQTAYAAPHEGDISLLQERDTGYCCISASQYIPPSTWKYTNLYLPRGNGAYAFNVNGCQATAVRSGNGCSGWKFTLGAGCEKYQSPSLIRVAPAADCGPVN